jgi:hypothetical protein
MGDTTMLVEDFYIDRKPESDLVDLTKEKEKKKIIWR